MNKNLKHVILICIMFVLSSCTTQQTDGTVSEKITNILYPLNDDFYYTEENKVGYDSDDGYSICFDKSLVDKCHIERQAVESSGTQRNVFYIDDDKSGGQIMFYKTENTFSANETKKLCSDLSAMYSTLSRLGYDDAVITDNNITELNGHDVLILETAYALESESYTGRVVEYFSDNCCYYAVTTITDKTSGEMKKKFMEASYSLRINEGVE